MAIVMSPIRQKGIAASIIKGGFKSTDFEFHPYDDIKFRLTYKEEDSYNFHVIYMDGNHYNYSPASDGRMSTTGRVDSWATILKALDNWFIILKANLAIGDPWAEIDNISEERIHIGDDSQDQLSREEINFVNEKLDIILEALKEFANDFERIKSDLDYLKSAGSKMSKKDWGTMVMGNVMGWAMSNAIHKDSLHDVWNIIFQNLGNQNLIN